MQRQSPLTWGLSALMVLSSVGFVGLAAHGPGAVAPIPSESTRRLPAASALAAAAASLEAGRGPAAGAAVTCSLVSPSSASCSARPAATFPANASWVNLTARALPGPGGRAAAQMAYDGADGYVLLYGGEFNTGPSSYGLDRDTWTFSGGVWTNITTTISGGPPPNALAGAMAYDPWDSEVVLFGGANSSRGLAGSLQSQTWTYHNKVWTNITSSAGAPPRARLLSSMVADTTDHRMILFGGLNNTLRFNDTWLFSAGTWSNITLSSGPVPRNVLYSTLSDDPADRGVLMTGINFVARPYGTNTWIYSGGSWKNITSTAGLSSPAPYVPELAYSTQTGAVVLVDNFEVLPAGGQVHFPITWVFFNGTWRNITGASGAPGDAILGTITATPDGAVLVFAGTNDGLTADNWFYGFSLPPSVTAQVTSPSSGITDVNRAVSVTLTASGGIAPTHLNLSWGDGAYVTGVTSGSHPYSVAGSHHISATISDFAGRARWGNTTVTVNPALATPVVTFAPLKPTTGQNMTFNASVSGGTPTYSFAWTFPAGVAASGPSVHHAFASAGSFSVSVEATDAAGATMNTTVTVNVTAAASSAFSLSSGTGLYVLIGVILLIVVIAIALAAMRMRRRGPPPPLTPVPPPSGTPPAPPSPSPTTPPPPPGAS